MKRKLLCGIMFLQYVVALSQNVGIGTTIPTGKLQINHRSTTIHPGVLLVDSTANFSGLMRFKNLTNPKYMQLWGFYENSYSRGQYLDISSDSTFVATFRGNGSVGIGVPTPSFRLDVDGAINSSSEYRLLGKPILRFDDLDQGLYRNLYAGDSAGYANTTGGFNTFVGGGAGRRNTQGEQNTFIGAMAGHDNTTSTKNTFIGSNAGRVTTGQQNTFVGSSAGRNNTAGYNNVFVGLAAGEATTTGIQNTMIGTLSGAENTSGVNNVFIGQSAGRVNTTGDLNTLVGALSELGSSNLSNATAIGYSAFATQSNTLILGSINGVNGANNDTRVGIGTTTPTEKLEVAGNIKLNGEINHSSTGGSNLLPIAFGNVTSTGVINSGTGNFSVTRTGVGSFTVDISGHSYNFATYATMVTVIGTPLIATTTSLSGNLLVRLYDLSGILTDAAFQFVVYKQ